MYLYIYICTVPIPFIFRGIPGIPNHQPPYQWATLVDKPTFFLLNKKSSQALLDPDSSETFESLTPMQVVVWMPKHGGGEKGHSSTEGMVRELAYIP